MKPHITDLFVADVISLGEPAQIFRVVGVGRDQFVLLDILSKEKLPISTLAFEDYESEPNIILLDAEPYNHTVNDASLTASRRKRRETSIKIIQPLLDLGHHVFDDRERRQAITRIVSNGVDGIKPDRKTVIATLDRYFRHGMTISAAMPQFKNIGGKGVRKTRGLKKLGRPRKLGKLPGVNITPELKKIIATGLRRYYLKNRKMNLQAALQEIITQSCMVATYDHDKKKIVHVALEEFSKSGFPSLRQIRYFILTEGDRFNFKRERIGRKKYDRDFRGTVGNAALRAFGPGSRFEIDATIANIYVVSELEPSIVIGRPVIYIVIDVFSKMVVGLYVGLEGPSWTGAMMALVNMVTNKKEFCAEYGVEIDDDEWPCHHVPEKILGDRGEIAGRVIENLQTNRHITVESAQSHRPDWKGTVEKMFDLLQCDLAPYTDSYVEPDFRERGAKNYVLDASWTVADVTRAMIDTILRLNNNRTLQGYARPKEMIADGVDAIPIDIWNWGIANRSGQLRRAKPEQIAFDVMPIFEANVTREGIKLRGICYTCEHMIAQRWLDKAKQYGAWKVPVSYDPRSARHVYLHVDKDVDQRGYVPCRLTDNYRQFEDFSFAEVKATQDAAKSRHRDRDLAHAEILADTARTKKDIEAAAKKRQAGVNRKPRDIVNRRTHFQKSKADARVVEKFDLVRESEAKISAKIIPIDIDDMEDDVSENFTFGVAEKSEGSSGA